MARAPAVDFAAGGAAADGFAPIARSIAASRSAAYTGLVRYAAMPSSAQRAWSPYSPDELSIMTVAPRQLGPLRDFRRDLEPVHVRHVRVEQDELERPVGRRGRRERLDGGASARDHGRRHPPASDLLGENAPVDVVVVDDQHVEVRRAGSAGWASGASVTSSATVK